MKLSERIQHAAIKYVWDASEENMENLLSLCPLDWFNREFHAIVGMEKSDINQLVRISLYRAANQYDPTKGRFIYYARILVKRYLITQFKMSQSGKNYALNKACKDGLSIGRSGGPSGDHDDEENFYVPYEDLGTYDPFEEAYNEDQRRIRLQWIKNNLTPLEQKMAFGFFRQESYLTMKQHYDLYNTKQVDNALQRVKRKLKERISYGEWELT